MLAISYVIIFTFHIDLNFDRLIIKRRFGHELQKLTNVGYLNRDQLSFANSMTMLQLQYFTIEVSHKKLKIAI